MTADLDPSATTRYRIESEEWLRRAVDEIADQLCVAVSGNFDFVVRSNEPDETLDKLALLINFVVEGARRNLQVLQAQNARLAELDVMKTNFLANVSHELRTPLTLILGPAENLLADAGLAPGHRQRLQTLVRNARLLLKHVNDLLDLSKLSAGQMTLNRDNLSLESLIAEVSAHFESAIADRRIRFAVNAARPVHYAGDPEKLGVALWNLVSNAFKFTPDAGQIWLELSGDDASATITVDDSGPGVPPALRELIFERFAQGESGLARRHGGTGLGLAIARDYIQLHGGQLSVGPSPLGGARFTVRLPRVVSETFLSPTTLPAAENEAGASTSESTVSPLSDRATNHAPALAALTLPPVARTNTAPAGAPVALVVDDNAEIRALVSESLGQEFFVVEASNGFEALERVREIPPDVVVSDVMMPLMSGGEFLLRLREQPQFAHLPVLLLSAKADFELRVNLLNSGAQDYVTKPFSGAELRARARNLAQTKRAREVLQRELQSSQLDLSELALQLAARKRELEESLVEARAARETAERASRARSEFLSLVSHEFKTPLTTLHLTHQILSRLPLPPGASDALQRLRKASLQLSDLVEALLEFTRMQSGHLVVRREAIDVDVLGTNLVRDYAGVSEEVPLRLERLERADVASPTPALISDPRLLRLLLSNLLSNALKFTEVGEVVLRTGYDRTRDEFIFEVRDTGPGIPLDAQSRIFEPFERLEDLRRKKVPGTGLGLALVVRLAEVLGGRIELSSQPGQGSAFKVGLPRQAPAPDAQGGPI